MTLKPRDAALVGAILRDTLGGLRGPITVDDAARFEQALAAKGLAITRIDARVLQPGDPDHPAEEMGRIVRGEADLKGHAG